MFLLSQLNLLLLSLSARDFVVVVFIGMLTPLSGSNVVVKVMVVVVVTVAEAAKCAHKIVKCFSCHI